MCFPQEPPPGKCSAQCWLGEGNEQLPLLHSTETHLPCETKALVFRWKSNTHRSLRGLEAIHYSWAWREEKKTNALPLGEGQGQCKVQLQGTGGAGPLVRPRPQPQVCRQCPETQAPVRIREHLCPCISHHHTHTCEEKITGIHTGEAQERDYPLGRPRAK